MSEQEVVIYTAPGVELSLPLDRDRETVWASQAQIQELFSVDQSGVSRHIRNVFKDAEVDQESNMRKVHIASSDRPVTAAALFVTFVARNGILNKIDGEPHISNNALAALTLMVAMSNPRRRNSWSRFLSA